MKAFRSVTSRAVVLDSGRLLKGVAPLARPAQRVVQPGRDAAQLVSHFGDVAPGVVFIRNLRLRQRMSL